MQFLFAGLLLAKISYMNCKYLGECVLLSGHVTHYMLVKKYKKTKILSCSFLMRMVYCLFSVLFELKLCSELGRFWGECWTDLTCLIGGKQTRGESTLY